MAKSGLYFCITPTDPSVFLRTSSAEIALPYLPVVFVPSRITPVSMKKV